jgi:hypothetical protein
MQGLRIKTIPMNPRRMLPSDPHGKSCLLFKDPQKAPRARKIGEV